MLLKCYARCLEILEIPSHQMTDWETPRCKAQLLLLYMARHVRNGWIHQGRLAGEPRFCCLTLSEKLSSHHIPLCLGSFEIAFEI
jgi:hypothetical protein